MTSVPDDPTSTEDLPPLVWDGAKPDDSSPTIRHTPGEWAGTFHLVYCAAARDLLTDGPVWVSFLFTDKMDTPRRVTGTLVAIEDHPNDQVFVMAETVGGVYVRTYIPVEAVFQMQLPGPDQSAGARHAFEA